MKVSAGDKLVLAIAKVAGTAARDWDEFLAAFRAYRDEQLLLMSQAQPDKVLVMQGRAQHAVDLCKHFEDCRAKAETIQEKLNGNR